MSYNKETYPIVYCRWIFDTRGKIIKTRNKGYYQIREDDPSQDGGYNRNHPTTISLAKMIEEDEAS